jgi:ATP-dependent DNA helicase RecG
MRPEVLNPLFAELDSLPGVGPRLKAPIARAVGGPLVRDAAFHLPVGIVDRRYRPTIAAAEIGRLATIAAVVEAHEPAQGQRPYRVRMSDETGFLTLAFFNPNARYLRDRLPIGATRLVSGEVTERWGERQMTHPGRILAPGEAESETLVEPVHRAVAGVAHRTLSKACLAAAARTAGLPEWADAALIARESWASFPDALMQAQQPEELSALDPAHPARRRLAYDELFARQVAMRLSVDARRRVPARPLPGGAGLTERLLAALPYAPTGAQARAFQEIGADMGERVAMLRLLQGDVGAGKTLVAAWAMTRAAEAGAQAALMAPTDLLARQHFASLEPLLAAAGLRMGVLSGRDRGPARRAILDGLAGGDIHAVCGTHALFQDDVAFANLGLVVVDEQHRFGVSDRRRLIDKGVQPHVLVMSATPIPRTLTLAVHGDLDVTRLDEKPPGRAPVATRALPLERLDEVTEAAARAMARDDRVYWVCPLVEESDKLDVSAATARFAQLAEAFPGQVVMVHGKMPAREKDAAMEAFRAGRARLLVATTVIEVGVDVPEASVMVIEHAERFGLAQLHQLRGRVGRGGKPGHCLLLYQGPLGETATRRIVKLRETEDGFEIAEEDFRLRGGGDPLGLRQSGLPALKLADLAAHADLLEMARQDARMLVAGDPGLAGERGKAARLALHLFDQQDAEAFLTTA